jgi:predicted ester cyclase
MILPTIPLTRARELNPARRSAIECFYGALASHDFDRVDDALTLDWEDIPLAPGQAHGPAGIKPIFAMLVAAFPDLNVEIVDALADGDRAAVRVQCAGSHDGDLFGVAATGKPVRFALHEFHAFEGDRICRTWHMEDLFGLFAQIGAWPAHAPEAA